MLAPADGILVIKLGALGDFIQALGPMAAIRRHHPDARITLLTTKPYEALARASGYVDAVMLDTRPKWHDPKGWLDLRQALNAGRFARVYDLQNNDRTALYLKLLSPRPEWVGAAKGASHRNASPERTRGLAFHGHVQTLGLAGISDVRIDDLGWMPGTAPGGLAPPYVLIVPGSAPGREEKRWPADRYAELCRDIVASGRKPVLLGSAAEEKVLDAIARRAHGTLNLCNRTALFDIPALARGAVAAIGNDTGPMHLIAPTGCRTIVLFSGSSDPSRHAPLGRDVTTLRREKLSDLSVEDVRAALAGQHISS